MPRYTNRRIIRVVEEATIGTDPGSGYTAILADEAGMPVSGAVVTPRKTVQPSFSQKKPSLSQRQWSATRSVELGGGGISGSLVVPPTDPLLKAAGMKRTAGYIITVDAASGTFTVGEQVTNTTQAAEVVGYVVSATATELVLYNITNPPADDDVLLGQSSGAGATMDTTLVDTFVYQNWTIRSDLVTATIHDFMDGLQTVIKGARSTVQFNFSHPDKPMAVFGIQGLYASPTEVTNPAVTYSTVEPPDCFPAIMSFGSAVLTDIAIENVSFDTGNQIVSRPDIKVADALIGFEITGRSAPRVTLDPEVSATLADLNAHAQWTARTDNVLSYQCGSTLGNIIRCIVPVAVIDEAAFADRNRLLTYGLTAGMYETPNIDDAEFFLIFS